MFKDHNELIEAVEKRGLMPETDGSAAPSMYRSWLEKVHETLSEAYPNLSMWETSPLEKKTTQEIRKVLVTVKRALKA